MTTNTGLLRKACNPYGEETGGPDRLVGGLYGPEHVGRIRWHCSEIATARYRMICPEQHRGQEMWLCANHRREIQRRQAGMCPRCAYPPAALECHEMIESAQAQLQALGPAALLTSRATSLRHQIEIARTRMDELALTGMIRKNPLKLVEVS